jgi:hypothetical protein
VVPIKEIDSKVDRRSREGPAEAQNKNHKLSTEDWLQRYIFTDIQKIFFGGIYQELFEWLDRLCWKIGCCH